MAQHFLLSPECRTLTIMDVATMREATAYVWFRKARWPDTDGKPTCPACGNLRCYDLSRARFKCSAKECRKVFTVTSGTAFSSRKLPFKKMIMAILLAADAVKGKAALQLSRELGVQYRTAWVLLTKLREVVAYEREEMRLDGEVEVDGKYLGGHVRKKNKAEDRVDRRLKKHRNPDRLCALAVRSRGPDSRTFTRAIWEKDGDAAWAAVRDHVTREATVFADEHSSYDHLKGLNRTQRVNHSEAYATEEGDNTNFVESFFSRVERSYVGVHHRFSVRYVDWYVADLAWKEDHRREGNRWQTLELLRRALGSPTSRYLCGYWQGTRPPDLVWEKPVAGAG